MDVSNGIDRPRRGGIPEQAPVRQDSYFDGNTWQYIGYHLLSFLVCTLTLGIAYPWMLCMIRRWEVKHTVIHGRRLRFDGKGHQLIGKYLLWLLLTLITFGIYGIWLGLGIKKWVVKHTFYADEDSPVESYFSGGAGGFLGIHLLAGLLTGATFGIARAWADVEVLKWEAKHTHIGGSPLEFNGTGGPLFVKYLLLGLLTPLTLGIYAIFWPVMYKKWEVQNTEAVYQTPRIQSQAKAHQAEAIKDYAKFHIAAAEQEISAIRSGYTGNETREALEELAERGNPFACYRLAELLKGDAPRYEDRALELLQTAAKGRLHQALYALAVRLPPEQAIPMLEEAARCGNSEAAWRLTEHYLGTDDLFSTAYWFKLSIEWEHPKAVSRAGAYERLVTDIALMLSEQHAPQKKSRKVLLIVLGVIGGLVAAAVIGAMAALLINLVADSSFGQGLQSIGSENGSFLQAVMAGRKPECPVTLTDTPINGQKYEGTTPSGKRIRYVYGTGGFYNQEYQELHVDFQLEEYDDSSVRIGTEDWKTEPIYPNWGVCTVYIAGGADFEDGQLELTVYDGDTDEEIGAFYTDIVVGDNEDTHQWLADKTADTEADTAGPVGEWCRKECDGDRLTVTTRILWDDGIVDQIVNVYAPVASEYDWTDFYYDGRRWYCLWEETAYTSGTYTPSEDSIRFYVDGVEEQYTVTQTDGKTYLIGESEWVKAAPIIGQWVTAQMNTYESGTYLEISELTLRSDGIFSILDYFYVWVDPDSAEAYELYFPIEGTHWGIPGMGNPSTYGTYELNGSELQLHFLWDDVCNTYDDYGTRQVQLQPDGTLLVNSIPYYPGSYDIFRLCDLFGIPLN